MRQRLYSDIPGAAMSPWQKAMLERELKKRDLLEVEAPVPAATETITFDFDADYRVVGGLGPSWNSGWYWTARGDGSLSVVYGTPPAVDGIHHFLLQRLP